MITKDSLMEYGRLGYVKSMNKGVSKEERAEQKRIAPKNNREKKAPEKEFILILNDKASNFTVKILDDQEITLENLKGKVVLVNFWATWCAPYLMEFINL